MTLAVRPPEYFPRLACAALQAAVDLFVVADTFSYSRQSAHNRCRIRTSGHRDSAWLTVPVVGGAPGLPIREVLVAPDERWRRRHVKTLLHHYSSAPYYAHYRTGMEAVLHQEPRTLDGVTVESVRWIGRCLGTGAGIVAASELAGGPGSLGEILEETEADELVTLEESHEPDRRAAIAAGITCRKLTFIERPRRQNFPGFVPDCSSLDLILNHGPDSAAYLLACLQT